MTETSCVRSCTWPLQQTVLDAATSLAVDAGVPLSTASAVRVPYRICPLGAHVDHQGGCISGMALDFGITLVFVPWRNRAVHMTSLNFSGEVRFDLDAVPPRRVDSGPDEENCWGNFVRGAVQAMNQSQHSLQKGMSGVLIAPERLDSSGISSSAAVGVACLLALQRSNGLDLGIAENIELDRLIENEYLGLKNGIMDQSICVAAAAGQLTVVDCSSRGITHHAAPWGAAGAECPYRILLAFSGMRAALAAGTGFNDSVGECHAAAVTLLAHLGRSQSPALLGEVSPEEYQQHKAVLGDTASARRAEHFFTETARVREGAALWEAGDIATFGRLMNTSGRSSAENYEVGSPELKFLQAALHGCDGVYGARFSGAGTRGACVALVQAGAPERVASQVMQAYSRQFPELADAAQVVVSTSGDGAQFLALN